MGKKAEFFRQQVVQPVKLSLQIEAQIRDAIEKKVFVAGDYLPSENQLCKIFGVSRNVVREALLLLSAKGLISIKKGKPAVVLEPTISNVLDPFSQLVNYRCGNKGLDYILSVRKLIEPEVASLSARWRTENDLEKMKNCLLNMQISRQNMNQISHWDIQFHIAIVNSCKNPLMPIVLEPIFHVLAKFHPPIFYDEDVVNISLEYHQKIIKAIEAKDSTGAFEAMKKHLDIASKHNLRLYSLDRTES